MSLPYSDLPMELCGEMLHPISLLKKCSRRYRHNMGHVKKFIAPHFSHDPAIFPAKKHKKSNTLFLLGSGPSINAISAEQWKHIAACDSLGWNFWLYHEFAPTYYFFELSDVQSQRAAFQNLLSMRSAAYAHTAVVMHDLWQTDERTLRAGPSALPWHQLICFDQLSHFYALHNIGVPGKTEADLRRHLVRWTWAGMFRRAAHLWYLPKKRSSISMLILFALQCGYEKIVLCGVDFLTPAYFYDDAKYDHLPRWTIERSDVHRTFDSKVNPLTIDKIIYALNDEVLKRKRVELYVGNPACPLHPNLPAYPF